MYGPIYDDDDTVLLFRKCVSQV